MIFEHSYTALAALKSNKLCGLQERSSVLLTVPTHGKQRNEARYSSGRLAT